MSNFSKNSDSLNHNGNTRNFFSTINNWKSGPAGTVILVATSVFITEFAFMFFLEDFLAEQFRLSRIAVSIFDSVFVTAIAFIILYRRITISENKFKKISESAQDAVIMMGPDQRISFWNKAAERTFGYTEKEAKGQNLHRLIAPPESQKAFAHRFHHFQETGEGPIIGTLRELIAVRKDGTPFPVELSISATKIDGQWHAIGIIRDISERKKMVEAMATHETALLKLNKKLRADKKMISEDKVKDEALLASIGEGILATDNTGKIIAINPAAEKILRIGKNDVVGKDATEMIHVIDERGNMVSPERHAVAVVITTGTSVTSNTIQYVHARDHQRTPVSVIVTPVILSGKLIGTISVFRDITKEKEIEKTRGDLLTLASHQLRTPLSGTKWLIETLQSGIKGSLNKDQKEYLDEIYRVNQRMTSLVVDMLGVLRMESGTISANKSQVLTETVLGPLLETFTSVAKSKQLTLRVEKDGEHTINTDPLLLRNILEVFLSNAVNYSNAGSDVVVSLKSEPSGIVFAVKDSGIGIPRNEQAQLFERFYRASNAKTFNTRGTGLGLYIAATLAKKIGAEISFETEEGKGSTFFVSIPVSTNMPLPETPSGV